MLLLLLLLLLLRTPELHATAIKRLLHSHVTRHHAGIRGGDEWRRSEPSTEGVEGLLRWGRRHRGAAEAAPERIKCLLLRRLNRRRIERTEVAKLFLLLLVCRGGRVEGPEIPEPSCGGGSRRF